MERKTHTLSVYLVKSSFNNNDDIVIEGLQRKTIEGIGELYYKNSFPRLPKWMSLFQDHNLEDLFSSSASCLLLVKSGERIFALTFGPSGRHYLSSGVTEERFGLIVTLNSVDKDSIRSIDTKTLESEGIQTRIQSARPVTADVFGFDVERDLVRSVTGISRDPAFGKNFSGKDSLRVSLKCNLEDLQTVLPHFLEQFENEEYKKDFPWVDALREIQDIETVARLDEALVSEMNERTNSKLWITVPEIIDWSDHGGFKYSKRKQDELLDDVSIDSFKEHLSRTIDLEDLRSESIHRFSESNEYSQDRWKVYECLYFEYADGQETYFLTGGKWYAVKPSLVEDVNAYYESFSQETYGLNFIDYGNGHSSENDYNQSLASENDACCMDGDLIPIEGRSRFEFCDVFTKGKHIIHVKKYSGSSVLSHLFNQGLVSGDFLIDRDFRQQINEKLPVDFKISDVEVKPNDSSGDKYTIIFAVISKSSRRFDLPFFSKMTLMHVTKHLLNLGFNVSLVQIMNATE